VIVASAAVGKALPMRYAALLTRPGMG